VIEAYEDVSGDDAGEHHQARDDPEGLFQITEQLAVASDQGTNSTLAVPFRPAIALVHFTRGGKPVSTGRTHLPLDNAAVAEPVRARGR
jgi:hypothetical protein